MKFTIEIDTEKDGEDVAKRMIDADKAWYALDEIRREARQIWKYEDLSQQDSQYFVDRLYSIICQACAEAGLDEVWK